jgi:hypothetical protein
LDELDGTRVDQLLELALDYCGAFSTPSFTNSRVDAIFADTQVSSVVDRRPWSGRMVAHTSIGDTKLNTVGVTAQTILRDDQPVYSKTHMSWVSTRSQTGDTWTAIKTAIQNYPTLITTYPDSQSAEIYLQASAYQVDENAATSFTILRDFRSDQTMTVNWAITNATVAPSSGLVTFLPSDQSKTIPVTAGEVTVSQTGQLTLSNLTLVGGTSKQPVLVTPKTASFTVIGLNAEFNLSSSNYSGNENASIQFTISRSINTDQVIDIQWTTSGLTVTPTSGTQRFQVLVMFPGLR